MRHYKSWPGLKKQLSDLLCDSLKGRITYFLTRYVEVHNSYGRASIRLDGTELVNFSWVEMYVQECDSSDLYYQTGVADNDDSPILQEKWRENGIYCDIDFLNAALDFLQMPIEDALRSDDLLIRILAIMDRRVGKRTLEKIEREGSWRELPQWARQFYELRLSQSGIAYAG